MRKAIQIGSKRLREPGFCAMLAACGFAHVAVAFTDRAALMAPDWRDSVRRLRELLEEHGLSCVQTHLTYYDILASSEITDPETDAYICRSVEATALLGAKWGAFHPRAGHSYGYEPDRELADNRLAVEKLLDTAARCGAGIAVENIPIFPDCPQYRFFTAQPQEHLELVDSFDPQLVGVCWDTGHANLMPYDQAEVIRRLGKRIQIVHLHNNGRQCDEHALPSVGTVDWDVVIPAIRETSAQTLCLEVETPDSRVRRSYYAHAYDCAVMLDSLAGGEC